MNRFLKLVSACIVAIALVSPGVLPAGVVSQGQCQAHEQHCYYVYYRTCPHDAWHYYGATYCSVEAGQAIRYIQSLGYETYYSY